MVNFRVKLGIDFDLSGKQIEILTRNEDTIVRAVPGSGKTTILTLKIKNVLIDDQSIRKVCCISYTNVNVDDLQESCFKNVNPDLVTKIDFFTFHKFCLEYILGPFAYLYRSQKGLRPFKKIFNYEEHGKSLVEFLRNSKNANHADIANIIKNKAVYYNFKYDNNKWDPYGDSLSRETLIRYLIFLNNFKLTDFNLISLLSLFILQQNNFVKKVLNRSIDWIFIDEFQDVSEIQCKIIEELRIYRGKNSNLLKWCVVGDPNQSIYGFAGANPRSMFDIKNLFENLNESSCEVKLDKTHRCSGKVFSFARDNYNYVLLKIRNSDLIHRINDVQLFEYLDDLLIAEDIAGNNGLGKVIKKNALDAVSGINEILKLKFTELADEEVCCIGITRYNSIDLYRQYKSQDNIDDGVDFALYSELYKDYELKYGFKYFTLFIQYLIVKNNFFNNRLILDRSLNRLIYLLEQLILDKIGDVDLEKDQLLSIVVEFINLSHRLSPDRKVFDEFIDFSNNLISSLEKNLNLDFNLEDVFISINGASRDYSLNGVPEPLISGFLTYITRVNIDKTIFEVKHIHKIKGLEYEQVIVQKIEELPYKSKSNMEVHSAIFDGRYYEVTPKDVYNYIQELNKLYVMLTRARQNLYLIINDDKKPILLNIFNNL